MRASWFSEIVKIKLKNIFGVPKRHEGRLKLEKVSTLGVDLIFRFYHEVVKLCKIVNFI